jgi:beta-lactamase regulating signal transducer with metallopeptidase domain
MQLLFIYCLKLSISLAVVSLFYQLVLRRLTFYKWNRYFLICYSCLCFLISFIDISPLIERDSWNGRDVTTWIPVVHQVQVVKSSQNGLSLMILGDIAGGVLILGIVIMFARLLLQLLSLRRLRRTAQMIQGHGPKVYEVSDSIIPFSFGASIYINKSLHTATELREIIRHEFVHVRQRHSIDILWGEIVCILNWYNPFAWLLKFSIRQNLEFIADSEVLQGGVNKREYQYLLLRVLGDNRFSIVQNFNFFSLKKRIAMMNKSKSATLSVVRFLFILPLFVVLLLAFRSLKTNKQELRKTRNISETLLIAPTDTIPKVSASPRKSLTKERTISVVSESYEMSDGKVVIHLQGGRTEEYDLSDKTQKEKFEEKYPGIYHKIVDIDEQLPGLKKVIFAIDPQVTVAVEPTVSAANVVRAVTAASVRTAVNCNVNAAVNNNISVVTANCDQTAAPVIANIRSSGVTAVAPVALSNGPAVLVDANGYALTGNEEILFTMTKNSTRQQLEDLKNQMKEKGFSLNFIETKYGNDGKLISITGTIESRDATGKFAATTFSKIIVYVIHHADHTYFRIDEQQAVKRVI